MAEEGIHSTGMATAATKKSKWWLRRTTPKNDAEMTTPRASLYASSAVWRQTTFPPNDEEEADNNNSTDDPIMAALSADERLDALRACDDNLIRYNPQSFGIIFRLGGRNLRMILFPLLFLFTWDVLLAVLLPREEFRRIRTKVLNDWQDLITPLLTPVSFLLVFRLGRAAVRFWDARAAVGKVIEVCRTLASTGLTGVPDDPIFRREFARWIALFPVANKNFLRLERRPGWDEKARKNKRRFEIGGLVHQDDQANQLVDPEPSTMAPIFVLNQLRKLAFRYTAKENPMLYRQLNQQIDTLTGAWGAMERINATPLPFVYVVHLRTFLIMYLLLWHMEAIAVGGWYAVVPLMAASWGLLGIETAAVECERPFQWHSNHLALGRMCVVVAQNVAQTLQEV